jgi:hypothetical protein
MCTGTRPVAIQKVLTTLMAPLGPAKYHVIHRNLNPEWIELAEVHNSHWPRLRMTCEYQLSSDPRRNEHELGSVFLDGNGISYRGGQCVPGTTSRRTRRWRAR